MKTQSADSVCSDACSLPWSGSHWSRSARRPRMMPAEKGFGHSGVLLSRASCRRNRPARSALSMVAGSTGRRYSSVMASANWRATSGPSVKSCVNHCSLVSADVTSLITRFFMLYPIQANKVGCPHGVVQDRSMPQGCLVAGLQIHVVVDIKLPSMWRATSIAIGSGLALTAAAASVPVAVVADVPSVRILLTCVQRRISGLAPGPVRLYVAFAGVLTRAASSRQFQPVEANIAWH